MKKLILLLNVVIMNMLFGANEVLDSNTNVYIISGTNEEESYEKAKEDLLKLADAFEKGEELEISYESGLLKEKTTHRLVMKDSKLYYVQILELTGRMEGYIDKELGKALADYLRLLYSSNSTGTYGDVVEEIDGKEVINPFYKAVDDGVFTVTEF